MHAGDDWRLWLARGRPGGWGGECLDGYVYLRGKPLCCTLGPSPRTLDPLGRPPMHIKHLDHHALRRTPPVLAWPVPALAALFGSSDQTFFLLFPARIVEAKELPDFLGREGAVLHLLHNHPQSGIPKMRATVEAPGGRSFIVMDGLDSTLDDAVRHRGRLSEFEARAVIKQLTMTVAHCHEHRIVLRDLRLDKACVVDCSQTKCVPSPSVPPAVPPLPARKFDAFH